MPGLCRSGCCESLRNMDRWEWPCALQRTEGNVFFSLDGWSPRRSCQSVKFPYIKKQQCFVGTQGCNLKIWWRSLSPFFYPTIQISRAHRNAKIHLGNPLEPASQIELMEIHDGFKMHGICITNRMLCDVWWITVSGRSPSLHRLTKCISWSSKSVLPLLFAVLSLHLPCNRIQYYRFTVIHLFGILVVQEYVSIEKK